MERKPVSGSSLFQEVGYSPETQILEIQFLSNGKIYQYSGFTPDDWESLRTAESKGRHFGLHIRGKFEAKDVTPKVEEPDDYSDQLRKSIEGQDSEV